jgi:hypothetical protein
VSNKLTPNQLLEIRISNSNRAKKVQEACVNVGWLLAYNISLTTGLVGAATYITIDNSTLLTASAISAGLAKLGPKITSAVERMKLSSDSEYYNEKVAEVGTAYASERFKYTNQNHPNDESKAKAREFLVAFCESIGLDQNSSFYRDCVKAGAQMVAAAKFGTPEFVNKANTLVR